MTIPLRRMPQRLEELADATIAANADDYARETIDPLTAAIERAAETGDDTGDLAALLDAMPGAFAKMKGGAIERIAEAAMVQADLIGTVAAMPVKAPVIIERVDDERDVADSL